MAPMFDPGFQVRKRRYDTEAHDNANPAMPDSYEVLPQKEFNSGASDGSLKKVALSVNDTLDGPVARNPKKTVNASKAVGYRARMLTTFECAGNALSTISGTKLPAGPNDDIFAGKNALG